MILFRVFRAASTSLFFGSLVFVTIAYCTLRILQWGRVSGGELSQAGNARFGGLSDLYKQQ
jgi:hypothetical protein